MAECQFLPVRLVCLLSAYVAFGNHTIQNDFLTVFPLVAMDIEHHRILDGPYECCRLGQGEVAGMTVEEILCRRFDAIDVGGTECDRVEVGQKNLILGVMVLVVHG